ncbi:ATP-dependent helicase [Listeria innocua]|uniref:UvrD-helicase domain-containing protein n=1 Tax=Listeria innocua TaxID=1642 RepID=UPI001842A03A|nr:UvrD-helicase domain-containing protein [Listeria innocua]EIR7348727.1 ATP-dependent helicase [Listeria innocua]EMD1120654.1 ATP-dependent helicase [Listeria innocua]MBF2699439.1 ATP-dependent helicase [Listeria innocua]HBM3604154.1 ATP-dependent helicase [Listeria innocua]HBM4306946.1 ATP-dependent helicase [Listeria innocua]
MTLSLIQEEIINIPGNLIVRASAGTGKTFTMVQKIMKEIEENNSHKVIAAITFTIKAAQEIRKRLSCDTSQLFIGTNNSFAIEEIIKPFMKDVYGTDYDIDMDADYLKKVDTFKQGLSVLKTTGILASYSNTQKNFIFELAYNIIAESTACKLYFVSKYFKIYIDEYQDCDKDMHKLFMYLCEELGIDTFIVGDEKQSIYMWRGAFPDAFKEIWKKDNFENLFMRDNYRSCQQIQNYTNLLCEDTSGLYYKIDNSDNIVWLTIDSNELWSEKVLEVIDKAGQSALLRYRMVDAKLGASELTQKGLEYTFIPKVPISEISTESAWLYKAIANYCILEHYSVYDLVAVIPSGKYEDNSKITVIQKNLEEIENAIETSDLLKFNVQVEELASYLNLSVRTEHLEKLYDTIDNTEYHVAFDTDIYRHTASTIHSAKGLEFDQVIVFAEDYRLDDNSSIFNHYVASSRAKQKLIIIKKKNYNANCFEANLKNIFSNYRIDFTDMVTIP